MLSSHRRNRRNILFAVVLGTFVLVLAVVASEVASRTLRNFICDGRGGGFHTPNAEYGWTHRPNVRVDSHACIGKRYEFRVMVETNSKGLCDREYAYERSPGVPRIAVLGDSVVEAAQVERDQGFTKVLERRLGSPQPPVDVINMGIAGFSTDNQLLFYRSEARKYSPDVVVSEFNLENDVGEISATIHRRVYTGPTALPAAEVSVDGNGELQIDTLAFRSFAEQGARSLAHVNRLDFWLSQNLYLYRRIQGLFAAPAVVATTSGPEPFFPGLGMYLEPAPAEWETAWKLVAAAYRRMARDVAGDGHRLLVVILPSSQLVSDERWQTMSRWQLGRPPAGSRWDREAPRRRIVAILGDLGIAFVDATGAMREALARTGKTGFFELDPHPTADGHRVIADVLEPVLRERLEAHRATH